MPGHDFQRNHAGDDITWLGKDLDRGDLSGEGQQEVLKAMVLKVQKQKTDLVTLERRLREGKLSRTRGMMDGQASSTSDQTLEDLERRLVKATPGLSDIKEEEEAIDG